MRSPYIIKRDQRLTWYLVALSVFFRVKVTRHFIFSATLKKKEKLEWTRECNEAFTNQKVFLVTPPILTLLNANALIYLCLSFNYQAMSFVLVLGKKIEQPLYFLIKVFKGVNARYKKIERLALAVVITTRKLIPYFQGHIVMVNANYPIHQVLKMLNLVGRMMSWSMELFEYIISSIPRWSIKSQVLAEFATLFHSLASEETPPYIDTIYGRCLKPERKWHMNSVGGTRRHPDIIVLEVWVQIQQQLRKVWSHYHRYCIFHRDGLFNPQGHEQFDVGGESDRRWVSSKWAPSDQISKKGTPERFKYFKITYISREKL